MQTTHLRNCKTPQIFFRLHPSIPQNKLSKSGKIPEGKSLKTDSVATNVIQKRYIYITQLQTQTLHLKPISCITRLQMQMKSI